ncbi:hypothetical protein Q4E93_07445 [Flavitalea sp. BT771]|uniref:hypothetical protein n=1 Tax=Flavitalea sp. BT771 TaxID=3063329 RepID=UPI0026E3B523|nr:hypothetical protein [Flavitalea sp. BT771]MDO6430414.1 hypothetical protein [Flavitalea sp. BT771]MDV6219446.1 hypothetical protein [Flavitalea sp. BT771]
MKHFPLICLAALAFACKKDKPLNTSPRHVTYLVTGTHLKLNFIDSTSGFLKDQLYTGAFHYEFWRKPGTSIGITVNAASFTDTIYNWEIRIDGKLVANAFSVGGAYLAVPYN